nr:hypothetical protein [Tanacetum cinerariifolium]
MDVMRRAKNTFKDEFNGRLFTRELSWEILRKFPKWDMPAPVPTFRVEGGNAELFGEDTRRRPPRACAAKKPNPRARRIPPRVTRRCLRNRCLPSLDSNGSRLKRKTSRDKVSRIVVLVTKNDGLLGENLTIIQMQ